MNNLMDAINGLQQGNNGGMIPQGQPQGIPQEQGPVQGQGIIGGQPANPVLPPQVYQQLMIAKLLYREGWQDGIPVGVMDTLDETQKAVLSQADNQTKFRLMQGLNKDQNFIKAYNSGNLPQASTIVKKYLDLFNMIPSEQAPSIDNGIKL